MTDPQRHSKTPAKGRHFSDAQLGWVVASRVKKSRIETIGSVAQKVEQYTQGNDEALAVRDAILQIVDDRFIRHVRLESVTGGRVILLVDNPDCLYDIRVQWHLPIKEHLEQVFRGMTVRGIVFKRGDKGLSFTADESR